MGITLKIWMLCFVLTKCVILNLSLDLDSYVNLGINVNEFYFIFNVFGSLQSL